MLYNYRQELENDIRNYLDNEVNFEDYSSREEAEEKIYDDLWIDDSVTGNGSGSYTFNTCEAWENLNGNLDLLEECANEFGYDPIIKDEWQYGPEWWDVSIRCYLLSECLNNVLDEYEDRFEGAQDEE